MNVLLIGTGGREHALALKISQSQDNVNLFIAPGNPGTAKTGINKNIDTGDFNEVALFCESEKVDLVVIGPEQPLVDGMADFLRKKGIKVFGPGKEAARIEGDKKFAKELMAKEFIPTADFAIFKSDQMEEALKYIREEKFPVVIKASGLAAGKGVAICGDYDEASEVLHEYFEKKLFGEAGETIVIEEFMEGEEASVFVITDGEDYVCLPSAQDHKRALDGDEGKNTGGMGAYSPAPVITPEIMLTVENEIIRPTLNALKDSGRKYNGCLYCGLMITEGGPKVVEFNCRFGDPEIQAVLPVTEGNFTELLYSAADGKINKELVRYSGGASVCVVAASEGYPGKYEKGYEITGIDEFDKDKEIIIYHAGTRAERDKILTSGGRVLGVTSHIKQNDLTEAKTKAYAALKRIGFNGITYRTDIADKGINR